ncbi:MAG: FkbM family methyltransferase, partial [Methylococcales bacterium]
AHAFLRSISGVIHVGANSGQERELYGEYDLEVVWIEPDPDIYLQLQANLELFPRQRAYQYLVTDKDDATYTFHIANNDGASSSILELNLHKDVWPHVYYEKTISLEGITLTSLVKNERIEIDKYDALIIDTQGSELLVLKGAESLLSRFKYIKTEVADFESYRGCPRVEDVESFLGQNGFQEFARNKFASRRGAGAYYDIVYRRLT